MAEIVGVVKSIIFESEDSLYKVIKVDADDETIVVGLFPMVEIESKYRFHGEMVFNEKYGYQMKMDSYESIAHDTKDGLKSYLASGRFKGIGEKTAQKIVDEFGLDAIEQIIADPSILKKVKISLNKANEIALSLKEQRESEEIFVKLYSYGLTPKMASKIYEKYETLSIKKITENPYCLIYDVDGYGFVKCDNLALKMGFNIDNPLRLKEGILYTLTEACNQKGYTFLTKGQLINTSYGLLIKRSEGSFDISLIENELKDIVNSNLIVVRNDRYYPKYLYDAENSSRIKLSQILDTKCDLPSKNDCMNLIKDVEKSMEIEFTPLQKDAIIKSVTSKVSIITGGPGTGKTTIIRGILLLEAFLQKKNIDNGDFRSNVLLVAPTGKAAKRLGISTNLEASTIHHALGYNSNNEFSKNEYDLISQGIIIIDESSMIDIVLFSNMLKAIRNSAKIIFVGDKNQLPSVGPGNVLKELIDSKKIKTTMLNEIMRQKKDSNIIRLSQMILQRTIDYSIFNEHKEVFFYDAEASVVLNNIESLITLFLKKGGNLASDLQVLAPMYSGPCGIDAINEMISTKFNSNEYVINRGTKKFKIGDKVLQLQNNPSLDIMNGDDGIIKGYEKKDNSEYLYIQFNDKLVTYDCKDLDNLTLGYAISIHKSQGSEYENVIIPIVPSFQVMLKPKLIYTAITRAKKKLIILGKRQSINYAVSNTDEIRQTSLFGEEVSKNVIYIADPSIPFDTLGEENMENISPYDFM